MDNKRIICGGSITKNIVIIDIESEEIKFIKTTHSKAPTWCQVTMDGNYILSSSERESRLFDIKTLEPLFEEDIRFVGLFSQNRLCGGVI